jgi:hypothetical protein
MSHTPYYYAPGGKYVLFLDLLGFTAFVRSSFENKVEDTDDREKELESAQKQFKIAQAEDERGVPVRAEHHTLFLNLRTWTVRLLVPRPIRPALASRAPWVGDTSDTGTHPCALSRCGSFPTRTRPRSLRRPCDAVASEVVPLVLRSPFGGAARFL